ncbi:MAG TPA: Rap1a/Tai family immunity protein [Phenylobacterium sp.]
MAAARTLAFLAFLATACAWGGPADAAGAGPTVQDLRRDCALADNPAGPAAWTREEQARAVGCVSYLSGVAHVLNLNCRLLRQGEAGGNLPAADIRGTSPADLVRDFLAWAGQHPEMAGEHESLAGIALVEALPCRVDAPT